MPPESGDVAGRRVRAGRAGRGVGGSGVIGDGDISQADRYSCLYPFHDFGRRRPRPRPRAPGSRPARRRATSAGRPSASAARSPSASEKPRRSVRCAPTSSRPRRLARPRQAQARGAAEGAPRPRPAPSPPAAATPCRSTAPARPRRASGDGGAASCGAITRPPWAWIASAVARRAQPVGHRRGQHQADERSVGGRHLLRGDDRQVVARGGRGRARGGRGRRPRRRPRLRCRARRRPPRSGRRRARAGAHVQVREHAPLRVAGDASDGVAVGRGELAGLVGPGARARARPRRGAEALPTRRIGHQLRHRPAPGSRVKGGRTRASTPWTTASSTAALSGRDHRAARGHRLAQGGAEGVLGRGDEGDPPPPPSACARDAGPASGTTATVSRNALGTAARVRQGASAGPSSVTGPIVSRVEVAQHAHREAHAHPVAAARHQDQARGAGARRGRAEQGRVHARGDHPVGAGQDLRERGAARLGRRDAQVGAREGPVDQRAQEGHARQRLRPVEGGRGDPGRVAQGGEGGARRQGLVEVDHVERARAPAWSRAWPPGRRARPPAAPGRRGARARSPPRARSRAAGPAPRARPSARAAARRGRPRRGPARSRAPGS